MTALVSAGIVTGALILLALVALDVLHRGMTSLDTTIDGLCETPRDQR